MTKVIHYVIWIDAFEQQCGVLKSMLQSTRPKDHAKAIVIDQYLSNNDLSKHKYIQNIKKLYKHAGKCDNQQQFKDILEAAIFSSPEGFTNNSPKYPMKPTPVNKPSARKSLCIFTNILYVKKKTSTCQVGAVKSERKAIKYGNTPWEWIPKQKRNSKINNKIKKYIYNWIMHHTQVLQSLIFNDCLKVNNYGHTEAQIAPKVLLQVSFR